MVRMLMVATALAVTLTRVTLEAFASASPGVPWTEPVDGQPGLVTLVFASSGSRGPESLGHPTSIKVVLSAPSAETVSVSYSVSGGDATAGTDFFLPDGQLTFAPGTVEAVVPLEVKTDFLVELDETVRVALSDPVNATMPDVFEHVYTIENDDRGICRGQATTFAGTDGADTIVGTPGDDVILARGGDDKIFAGGGDDLICAGAGDDEIAGGDGDDQIRSGPGADTVHGGPGSDDIAGDSGEDQLAGDTGADFITGGGDGDDIRGGGDGDFLFGGGGDDVVDGGAGGDVIGGGRGEDDVCIGGTGRDLLATKQRSGCETVRGIP